MKCGLCGYEFDEDRAQLACSACPIMKGCKLIKCPRCGFEAPPEPKWFKRFKKKMSGVKRIGLALVIVLGFCAENSFADRRSYVWTYEYMTMPKGMWELEYYLTSEAADINRSNINTLKHWFELEYGITNNWDVAMYQMWKTKNKKAENDTEYDGFKLRTRYRFGKTGQYIVDPEVYLEYIRDDDLSKPNVGEVKLILGKDFGDFNISYNQILKRNLEKEGKTGHEYAVGVNYRFTPAFKFGLESKGVYNERKSALGPTLSWSGKKIWVSLGVVFGLNERSNDLETRIIAGIPF